MQTKIVTPQQLKQLIQGHRKSKGLTQADMAARIGLSQARFSSLELRPERITIEQLLQTLNALGLSMSIQEFNSAPTSSKSTQTEW